MAEISKLLKEDPLFFLQQSPIRPYWDKVHQLAIVHTRKGISGDKNPIIDAFRPHEGEKTRDYRTVNERNFTKAGFDMFLTKVARAVRQCVPNASTISETLREWLASMPFVHVGEAMDLQGYALDIILRKALESPNQILLAFPFYAQDKNIPPNRLEDNVELSVKPLVISHKDLRFLGEDCFSFSAGKVTIKKGASISQEELLFSADSEFWYQHIPKYVTFKGSDRLAYDTIVWYKHGTGENLLNFLPGEYTCSRDDEYEYLTSFIDSYYSYAGAAMEAASDEKIVNLRYSYPIPEIKPTACHKCKGDESDKVNCKSCNGQGWTLWPSGPSAALISEDTPSNPLEPKGNGKPAIQWHMPPLDYSRQAIERIWVFIDKAYQSIGLRMFTKAGASSSGEALQEWKDDELAKISRVATSLYSTIDRFLYQVESILVRIEGNRIKPRHIVPEHMGFVDLSKLKEEAKTALPEDKLFAHIHLASKKYKDDPIMNKGLKALLCYTPYMTMEMDELKNSMAKNVCSKEDIIKRQWGSIALHSVIEEFGKEFEEFDKKDIHVKLDEWFEKEGLIVKKIEIFESDDFKESSGIQTSNIINIIKEVYDPSSMITREVGLELLKTKFGYSSDGADRLLAIGKDGISNEELEEIEEIE